MVDQVVEGLAVDGDFQLTAAGEVAGAEPAGVVDLVEEDLLVRAVRGAPGLDAPLQGADLAIGEAFGKTTLQVFEEGLDLQARVDLEFLDQFRPDVGEGVLARAPVSFHDSDLAGQPLKAAVLLSGLGVEAGLEGGQSFAVALIVELQELLDLLTTDHPEPPCLGGSGQRPENAIFRGSLIAAGRLQRGISNRRWQGSIIAVRHMQT